MSRPPLSLWPGRLLMQLKETPEPLKVIASVAASQGYALRHVLGRERTEALVEVRHHAFAEALAQGFSSTAIARATGRNHSSVLYAASAHARRQREGAAS